MSIELSKDSRRRLMRRTYATPVHTSLLTHRGPATGTVWFDKVAGGEPFIVSECSMVRVNYEGIAWDSLDDFMEHVASGRYILIGIRPPLHSHIVV